MMIRILALLAALGLSATPAAAGLVAYWPFNDTATLGNDVSGNGTVLTATAGATFTATGKLGGGLSLNGTSGYLGGSVVNLPVGNSPYSQVAWFKPAALGARGIIGWGNYGVARQVNALRLYDSGNGFRHYWWAQDLDAINLSTNFLDGNWHHVATTYDGTTRRIYLDGVQVQSDVPGVNGATAANFRIGLTNAAEYFSGTLDEVYVYNNALSVAEVQSLASGAGPQITAFTCNKTNAYEGEGLQLGWTVNTSSVTGTFSYEIKNGATLLNSGASSSGTFNTIVPDLAGAAQTITFTLRAIEAGGNNVTNTATVNVAADPGIPSATGQTGLTVQSGTPLGITLAGTDPNGGALTYSIVAPPSKGSVSAGSGPSRTYTATAGMYGTDSFTFKVNDGKYDSAPVFVRLNILTPPLAPTSVVLDDLTIQPTNVAGDFLSNISSADPNAGEAHTFTLVSGAGSNENANFSISGHQLRAAISFAALTGAPQRVRIRSTDTAGLFVEGSFILNVTAKQRSVVINEIHYNGADNTVLNSFIELYNAGTAGVDLGGWRISGGVDYVFPAGTTIAAGAYLLVAEDPATMTAYFGKTALGPWNNAVVVYPDGSKETNGLSNDGATVRLRNSADQIISEVDYEPRSPWPAEGNGEGSSIELINPNLDESHGSNWAAAKNGGGGSGVTYVPAGSNQWKYFKGFNPPPATWFNRTGFDDSTWLPGTASIGYADADDATTLTDMQSGYQIIYFRHAFTIPAGGVPSALALRVYVDDGCIVYINGQEIPRRFHILAGTPGHQPPPSQFLISGVTVEDHEASTLGWDSYTIPNAQNYLVEGTNVIAVMGANASLASTDFSFDLELKKGSGEASPGAQNISFAANAAPAIRKVEHAPQTPASTDPIIVTAKITDPNGVASASLAYQICTAGNFIPSTLPKAVSGGAFVNVATPLAVNPAFELPANWITIAMNDDGLGDDVLGGDGIWTATIPPQAHRTLVRYRITVADNTGASARVPYAGDLSLNFACFVYNGVPDYQGTPAADLKKLPVYHFLTRKSDYDQCVAFDANAAQRLAAGASWTFENWECAFVSDGVVYDHVPYRLKGANGRYVASGTGGAGNAKRAFKLQFTKGHDFEARDEKGNAHPSKWSSLVTENCWENRATYTFSLNEMVTFHLLNHLGVPSPLGNWAHFRTVMQTAEQPDAFHGDFWGLMYVHENYDRRFLQAHDLKKGNLYKLTRDGTAGAAQFRYQSAFAPINNSDHDELYANLKGTSTPAYITGRVNLNLWSRYHALAEAVRHYDYWPNGDNNAGWYFYPKYEASNGNKGVLWYLPNDVDATWGPTWNNGHDLVHNSLFNDTLAGDGGGDASTNPTLWPVYFNQVHEVRTLLWQPDQINPLIDEFASVIRPLVNAEYVRWLSSPADAGNFGGLNTYGTVGQTALNTYLATMKDFAFDADNNGSSWPGGNVGAGGRAAFLDALGVNLGEDSTKYPARPTLTYTGPASYPLNDLRFTTSAFSDPQGAASYAAIQWRMAEVNTSATYNPAEPRLLEIDASFDSGEIAAFAAEFKYPATSCIPGHRYRARVRMKDDTGRWSNWSPAAEFTAGTFDSSAYASALVVSEIMYHATNPTAAEQAVAAAQSPAQLWTDDDFDFLELRNVSASPVNLSGLQFDQGFDYAFPVNTVINPGASIVLVQNLLAFNTRYGANSAVLGAWDSKDKLSNGGETLTLRYGQLTTPVFSFAYGDKPAQNWPSAPDGGGASLVRIAPEDTTRDPNLGINWRSSLIPGGTPGTDDRQTFAAWLTANSQSGMGSDTDADGLTNLAEYALGGNPGTSSASLLPTGTFQSFTVNNVTANYATLTFRRANAADNLAQAVEFSTDLSSWPMAGVQVSASDNGDGTRTEVWRSASSMDGTPRMFGRVRFTTP